jgi:pimeloyl-ACP methyl ester carboxylesterase
MFHKINGSLFNVVSFGAGEDSFLAVGGWIGPWQVWRQVLEVLSADRRCVAFDHRGAGQTSGSAMHLRFEDHVDDIFAIMDEVGLDRCWIGGESNGGLIAASAVLKDPTRFSGLAIIASSPRLDPTDARAAKFAELLESDWEKTISRFVAACVPEADSDHLRDWLLDMLSETLPENGPALIRNMKADVRSRLHDITLPTVVIHGALDTIQPPEEGLAFRDGLPQATYFEIADAGHVPTITRPEVVAGILRDFMSGSTA